MLNSENIIKNIQTNFVELTPSLDQIKTLFLDSDNVVSAEFNGSIQTVRTTCPYCGVGCGVLASFDNASRKVTVKGDPEHPANFGKLCSKGSNLAETLGVERRLTHPYYQDKHTSMNGTSSDLSLKASSTLSYNDAMRKEADWDTVLDDVANRLGRTIKEHGPESVMFYVSGQLLTEDYYVANKFMKGFIGSNNIDSNSRLCMSSAVAGHKRAFGADLVPGSYTDFEDCDLLVLIGSNMAWCHPILFGRFLKAKQENPNKKLIVIDPRRTDSCEFADLHLPLAPGTDTHLYNGLLKYLNENGHKDDVYASKCEGLEDAVAAAELWSLQEVAKATDLSVEQVEQFYELVAATNKTVSAFSMGVNQSSSGTDKVNAIINSHLLTGRVGKPGASPFSLTGQPNAMGGREVGALSNLLAGHLELDNAEHRQTVSDFWKSSQPIDTKTGIKACDAADAILSGKVKAIWIVATNPVVSLPEADKFKKALTECDLVIVSECSKDSDTIRCADIVLPAQGWSEKSGTVTNSERRISRQRSIVPAVGESKPDWWIFSQVAKRMGFEGFDYNAPSEIFLEHATLTSYQNAKYPRHLDLLTELVKHNQPYESMQPLQWGSKHIDVVDPNFKHKAPRLIAITPPKQAGAVNKFNSIGKLNKPASYNTSLNLRLITGRLRDQWHTMTRTALAPKLNQQQAVPTLTLHPKAAEKLGVISDDFVCITPEIAFDTDASQVLAQVEISDEVRIGDAFMPMHWSDAFANLARVGTLIPTKVDPISSQPELKNSAITVMPVNITSFGRILVHSDWLDAVGFQLRRISSQQDKAGMPKLIWSISRQQDSVLINLASGSDSLGIEWLTLEYWQNFVELIATFNKSQSIHKEALLTSFETKRTQNSSTDDIKSINSSVMINQSDKQLRFVVREKSETNAIDSAQEKLLMAIYIAPKLDQLPSIHWLNSCFADMSSVPSVKWLLAGRPASGYVDPGPLVCACMGVGANTIIEAITSNGCEDAIAVGKICQAGTNCGSCVGQINELIKTHSVVKEAALL
ncbi:nitrate reductase [Psychrobacter sp.]|uniref:nitrate reductase n=1 Tax=Psychrobacter sp. TaxID=56811 RepID=UPI0025CF660D|nr:nitrate reductase [Psychrobacter sp.]